MEIKNLLSQKTQQAFSTAGQGIKKKFKPAIDIAQEAGTAIKQEFSPMVENVSNVATNIAKPIVEPIRQAQQKSQAIGEINTFFNDSGINIDDIKALAEDEGVDFNEVITKFQNNGIKVQGMEDIVAKQQKEAKIQAEQPTDFSDRGLAINPEYDQVDVLGNLTANIPKFQSQPDEGVGMSVAKMVGNIPSNAIQVGAGIGDIGLSYLRNLDQGPIDSLSETAKAKVINPTYQQALGVADIAKKEYQKGGVLGATEALTQKAKEFVVENPVATIGMVQGVKNIGRGKEAIKTAVSDVKSGNIGKATTGLAKSTGIGLKETLIDPVTMGVTAPIKLGVAGVKGASKLVGKGVSKGLEKAGVKSPLSQEYVPAKTEAGTAFDVEQTPTLGKNITDKLFKKDNEILAQQSVFPKATKEKTTKARLEASKIALDGIKQLYEDKANGIVKSDIRDMGGGVDGVLEGIDYHGKKIGEITKENPSIIDAEDLIKPLKESLDAPFADVNPAMKSTVENIVKAFEKAKNKADIATLQEALSNIKSEIFDNRENIAKLYKTSTGRALNEFLKNIEERFNTTIENTSGNSAELKNAKTAYSKYKKIQKDLTDSYMVELRNQGKGITGTAGKVAGLYEVLSNPSLSGVFKAIALKQAGETMQYYKSRGGNYETLIRNLDRESVQRNLTPNIPKNDSVNTKPTSGNMDNQQFGIVPKKGVPKKK